MRYLLIFFILITLGPAGKTQHQDVYPGLHGEQLLDSLRAEYTPEFTLGYNFARDTLFANILKLNDSLECIYSGFKVHLDSSMDPTTDAFAKGLNTEHIYPQAKGAADEPMRSNMYNLFPTLEYINNDRGNLPYRDINDPDTRWWYYERTKQSTIPAAAVRDRFSEGTTQSFEPREIVKGDIARAVFYFYTIYKQTADLADPQFFFEMLPYLCEWHFADPADQTEWNRNLLIAAFQDGKPNPFILDCSLPERSYCAGTTNTCITGNSGAVTTPQTLSIIPTLALTGADITIEVWPAAERVLILDAAGQVIRDNKPDSDRALVIHTSNWPAGVYFVFSYAGGMLKASGKFTLN